MVKTLSDIRLVIFDQDETLVNNGFKSNGAAFLWALNGDYELQSVFLDIMLTDPTWRNYNRFEMFRQILVRAGRWKDPEDASDESWKEHPDMLSLTDDFSKIVRRESIRCGLYPDVLEALSSLQASGIEMHVVSGAAHEDVVAIATALGSAEFMQGIYGFGWRSLSGTGLDKEAAGEHILAGRPDLDVASQVVMVGDGASDVRLARHIECRFVGIPRAFTNTWEAVAHPSGIEFREDMVCINDVSRLPELLGL